VDGQRPTPLEARPDELDLGRGGAVVGRHVDQRLDPPSKLASTPARRPPGRPAQTPVVALCLSFNLGCLLCRLGAVLTGVSW